MARRRSGSDGAMPSLESVVGVDGAADPFAGGPGEKSTLPAEPADEVPGGGRSLEEFLAEGTPAARRQPAARGELEAISEMMFSLDLVAEYKRLESELRLGGMRTDRGSTLDALDRVDSNTMTAAKLHRMASAQLEGFELDARERQAAFREEARRQLEAEKEAGTRKKQITLEDISDYCLREWSDDWRDIESRRARYESVAQVMLELVLSYRSRQASLRQLANAVS